MEGAFVQNLLQNYTPILYVFDLKIHGREPYIIRVSIHLDTMESARRAQMGSIFFFFFLLIFICDHA